MTAASHTHTAECGPPGGLQRRLFANDHHGRSFVVDGSVIREVRDGDDRVAVRLARDCEPETRETLCPDCDAALPRIDEQAPTGLIGCSACGSIWCDTRVAYWTRRDDGQVELERPPLETASAPGHVHAARCGVPGGLQRHVSMRGGYRPFVCIRGVEQDAAGGDDLVFGALPRLCESSAAPSCPDCGVVLLGCGPREPASWECPNCGSSWSDTRTRPQWHLLAGAVVIFGALPDEAIEGLQL